MTDEQPKQPGWYPSPDDDGHARWWDGRGWTDHTQPVLKPAANDTASAPRSTPPTSKGHMRRGVPVLAVVGIGVGALIIGGLGGFGAGAFSAGVAGTVLTGATSRPTSMAPQSTGTDANGNGIDDGFEESSGDDGTATSDSYQYTSDLFSIKLKTVRKECFGSAGCNVTVKPVLSMLDPSVIPDGTTGTLTYEIRGGEDGIVVETIDLDGAQYTPEQTTVSTPSSGTKLKVKVTDVETNL